MYGSRARAIATALAHAFLAGPWREDELVARGAEALAPRPRWLRGVVRVVLASYHRPPLDRPRELAAFIAIELERIATRSPRVRRWFTFEQEMGPRRWPVPEIASLGELAAVLELSASELAWFADTRGLERSVLLLPLRHYRYVWLARNGGPPRVIEQPKPRLKALQRRILHELLDWIPAHEATHGFRPGRSVRSHAAAHTGRRVVLRFDLEDFFASVEGGRVYGIFREAGYPESVAHALTALCTNVVPLAEWMPLPRPKDAAAIHAHSRLGRRLAKPHLPQGAPTSPALANLCAFGLDRRLAGLAAKIGATYSRYADDLTFSGDALLVERAESLRRLVEQIARDEGFRVNERKSRLMTRAGRQRICGVVVNEHPNVARREYDLLKAILYNAAAHGPASQNRAAVRDFRAHLLGRISWVELLNPTRGAKLRRRFELIRWD